MVVAVAVGLVLMVLELAAVPIATRVLGAVVGRCLAYDSLEVTAVDRPVLPSLLLGRARDVELHATGVVAGELRIADARLRLPAAVLPWAVGDPEPGVGGLRLRIDEPDLEHALEAALPLRVPLELELQPGVATIGSPLVPLTLDLEVELDTDGTVRLRPVAGGELLDRLGIARSFPPGDAARVTALDIGDGQVRGALDVAVVPGIGGEGCERPRPAGAVPWPDTSGPA